MKSTALLVSLLLVGISNARAADILVVSSVTDTFCI
jgi:hypothetical protein